MKVERKDGKRVVTLEGKDQTVLEKAKGICEELFDLVDDPVAKSTAVQIDSLVKDYSATKRSASQQASSEQNESED